MKKKNKQQPRMDFPNYPEEGNFPSNPMKGLPEHQKEILLKLVFLESPCSEHMMEFTASYWSKQIYVSRVRFPEDAGQLLFQISDHTMVGASDDYFLITSLSLTHKLYGQSLHFIELHKIY